MPFDIQLRWQAQANIKSPRPALNIGNCSLHLRKKLARFVPFFESKLCGLAALPLKTTIGNRLGTARLTRHQFGIFDSSLCDTHAKDAAATSSAKSKSVISPRNSDICMHRALLLHSLSSQSHPGFAQSLVTLKINGERVFSYESKPYLFVQFSTRLSNSSRTTDPICGSGVK